MCEQWESFGGIWCAIMGCFCGRQYMINLNSFLRDSMCCMGLLWCDIICDELVCFGGRLYVMNWAALVRDCM